jgi:glycosyltransferase involved in cell wall biosynthesis
VKVLLALQQLSGDGVSRFALDLGAELRALGAKTKLFVFRSKEGDPVPHEDAPQIPVFRGQPENMRRRYWAPILSARLLAAVAAADVVVAAQESGEGVASAFLAAQLLLTPIVISVQNNVPKSLALSRGWTVPVLEYAYPRFDRLICASSGVPETAVAMGVSQDKITVIPNGVNVDRVRRLAAEPVPEWVPDEPFVVGVGRLEPQKGFDLLIRAVAEARADGLSQKLVLLGEGERRQELEELSAALGVSDLVLMPGYCSNPFPIIERASAFCLPSRFEGYGLVVGEALCLGKPIIAADCISGPRDILDGGEFGRLVEVESVAALTRALLDHAADPGDLERRAASGAAHADRISIQSTAAAYMREITQVARDHRHRPTFHLDS